MEILNCKRQLCHCCMEEHEVKTISMLVNSRFKDTDIEYDAVYYYCDNAHEVFSDESMLSSNDISMKDAYRQKKGLLTSNEIVDIRKRYGITQSDLCLLLGWGAKTITRYESHQVQDFAHDTILRKLATDPEWYICLLNSHKNQIEKVSYRKYMEIASDLYESDCDSYLKRAIKSKYACIKEADYFNGNTELSFDRVVDVIRYYSNSEKVTKLYKVKLMKLLWYADALSFKRRNRTITGLIYQAYPMGAVPIGHESIIDFSEINYEETDFGEGTGYHFLPTVNKNYKHLTNDDFVILDSVIRVFGLSNKDEIVQRMHQETAYINTPQWDMIPFCFAKELSIS